MKIWRVLSGPETTKNIIGENEIRFKTLFEGSKVSCKEYKEGNKVNDPKMRIILYKYNNCKMA